MRERDAGEIAAARPPRQKRRPRPAAGGAAVVPGVGGGRAKAPSAWAERTGGQPAVVGHRDFAVVRRRRDPRQRRWAGRRGGDRVRVYLPRVPCQRERNRDGRGEREEEQARRSRGSKQRSFLSWGIHCLIVRSILLRAFVMQCIERIGPRPSLSVKQLVEPAKSKPADVLTILRPASWQLLNF